ncbi:MAG: hypothetical protein WA924_10050 [Burkholderiaceae bacterium]
MPHPMLRSFDSLSEAEQAARRLFDAGIPSSQVQIESRLDETGATSGNFATGNPKSGRSRLHESSIAVDDREYRKDFASTEWRGTVLLTVDVDDDRQQEKAAAALGDHGIDPNGPRH